MEYTTSIILSKDKEDTNFIHLYFPGKSINYYICSMHTDAFYDLFGKDDHTEIMETLNRGPASYTLGLQLKS